MTEAVEAPGPAIRRGPRWDAVLASVAAAEAALEAPLTDEEQDGGWTAVLQEDVLHDVGRVRDELVAGASTRDALADWVGVDAIDAEGDALRVDAVMEVDLALGDLERAERALADAEALEAVLSEAPTSADRGDGYDERVRDELLGLLGELTSVLAAGEALGRALMDDWADALRALGYRRATLRPGVDDDGAAAGFTGQRIEQFPPGRRFEAVAIFDGSLFNVAFTDVLDEESHDGDEDPSGAAPGDGAGADD